MTEEDTVQPGGVLFPSYGMGRESLIFRNKS